MHIHYYYGTHDSTVHSSHLIKIALFIFQLLSSIICNIYVYIWAPGSGLAAPANNAGLYFTRFNFSDERRKVLIAFAFVFYEAESCSKDYEGDRSTFPPLQRNYQRAGWFSNRSLHFSEYDYMLSYASPMFLTTHSRKQKTENLAYWTEPKYFCCGFLCFLCYLLWF